MKLLILIITILFTNLVSSKEYHFSYDWFKFKTSYWPKYLKKLKGKKNLRYLEVGVFEGRSFFWVLDNIATHPTSKLYALDFFVDDYKDVFYKNMKISNREKNITVMKGDSRHTLKQLPENYFDLIYIDASHLAKDVLRDAVFSWDLLKTNGILIFDDYQWHGHLPIDLSPKVAIDSFITAYEGELDVIHRDYEVIIKKKRRCLQVRDAYLVSRIDDLCFYWNPKSEKNVKDGLYTMEGKKIDLSLESLYMIKRIIREKKFGEVQSKYLPLNKELNKIFKSR